MAKSIKLKDENYIDSTAIMHNRKLLSEILKTLETESGSWTPTLTTVEGVEPTVEYTTRRGRYVKMGNLVFISFYIRGKITALNGTNNYAFISGLPIAHRGLTLGENVISVGNLYQVIANETTAVLGVYNNGIRIQNSYGASAAKLKVTPTNYMEISGSGWYEAG